MLKSLLHALAISTVLTGIASAAPLTFDLQNVTFSDGTAATGSFVYDPTTVSTSTFDIATSAGSSLPAFTFTPADSSVFTNADRIFLISDATFPVPNSGPQQVLELELTFDSAFSASANPDAITLGAYSVECLDCNPSRSVTGGSVLAVQTMAATPEPSTIALLGTGMLGIAGLMRKRFAQIL